MGKHIDAIKRQENLTPQEVMASFIWERAINSRDHFFSLPYYEYKLYLEYCDDNSAFRIDTYYLKQDNSFSLVQPDWNSVLAASKQILEWAESLYAAVPKQPTRRKRRGSTRQQNPQSVMNPGATWQA